MWFLKDFHKYINIVLTLIFLESISYILFIKNKLNKTKLNQSIIYVSNNYIANIYSKKVKNFFLLLKLHIFLDKIIIIFINLLSNEFKSFHLIKL